MPSSDPPPMAEPLQMNPALVAAQYGAKAKGKQAASTQEASTPAPATAAPEEKKLTGAELKKKKQEEKAARRAQAIASKQVDVASPIAEPSPAAPAPAGSTPAPRTDGQEGARTQQRTAGPVSAGQRNIPVRQKQKAVAPAPIVPGKEDKTVEFFRHLYKTRTTSIAGASKEIHPAILALGLQMSNYTICGSCARLVATLQAFKRVIESYTTPPGNSLTRHLTSHVLSPQIDFLTSCRPISISMGNAIRWLKLEISKVDVDTPESEAKENLCNAIDVFLRERVTFADQIIAQSTADKIKDGDVIMTYAKSSIVQRSLVQAHNAGKKFKVIVVDSRPLHEGKHLATALVGLGMDVKYCLLNGLSHNIQDVTKVLLGAHAMMSNGRLFSRVGTALVAMEANEADKPVIVLCETIKFTERVALDSFVHNEIAPADELVIPGGALTNWENMKKLQLCNPMFDVTPAEYIQMIITESGNVPPTSVPVLHRLGNESQG
ncbi:related to translation initiation factor eIF2B, 71 kDa (delta) subunit [Phialocephala subalpina]|uniref:Translation initiation factor eIF2B subunit delta n=1 Tax=Phialocephala subalpina TaxID=576137 RepID=A0A1L7WWW0_9HELO|nr:related to translation initiation factor eIF2B, 71 kDa (delta) subunit [Phialocephala subalpina]